MTADKRAALVERMADAAWNEGLSAALDLALEEAAQVADSYHRIVETRRDMFDDGNITVTKGHTLADPRKIAAAIRSLKGDNNG